MSTVRRYPLPPTSDDPRFTLGLLYDLTVVLESAGYPSLSGNDIIAFRQRLYGFLYGDTK
jgi:hypothetical protein